MSGTPSLQTVRRRTAQLVNYEDGLWDLLLGTVFMLLAVYPVSRARLGPNWNVALFVGLMLLAVVLQTLVRRSLSTPRLGYVKARRTPALKVLLAVTLVLVALTVGLVILTLVSPGWLPNLSLSSGPEWLRTYTVEIVVLFVLAVLFSAMGYAFGVPRLYLYGWLLGAGNLGSVLMNEGAPEAFNLPMGIAAGAILIIGAVLLVRFVRKYPMHQQEA
jgi:hypothetical protein